MICHTPTAGTLAAPRSGPAAQASAKEMPCEVESICERTKVESRWAWVGSPTTDQPPREC
eukprot:scaffold52159_cov31-Tisochrysis_lutea.AAC.7